MSIAEELNEIAEAMEALEQRFVNSSSLGLHLKTEDEAKFKRLVVEAKSLIDEALGFANDFSLNLVHTTNSMQGGFLGGISLAGVRSARELVDAAAGRAAKRAAAAPTSAPSAVGTPLQPYVHLPRIEEIRRIRGPFDMTRLVRLCEELNSANQNDCHMSKAMLVRAIVDHIPPILRCKSFPEVANNYAGSKSLRGSMQHLENSLRNIADAHLHVQVRKNEVLPTPQQVDFRQDLDALLAEIVRVSK